MNKLFDRLVIFSFFALLLAALALETGLAASNETANSTVPLPNTTTNSTTNTTAPNTPTNTTNQTTPANATNSTNNSTNTTAPVDATVSVSVQSEPAGAWVTFDGIIKGVTPALGEYLTFDADAGDHELEIELAGYSDVAMDLVLEDENVTISVTLNRTIVPNTTNQTNQTTNQTNHTTPPPTGPAPGQPRVVNTDVEGATPQGDGYFLLETGTAEFTVQFNQTTTITWYVNGVRQEDETTVSDRDTLAWNPSIIYSGGKEGRDAVIVASGNGMTNETFPVHVGEVINPFWAGSNGGDANIVHVYTQDAAGVYTGVSAELTDRSGTRIVPLSYQVASPTETLWHAQVTELAAGNTFITAVTIADNSTGIVQRYPVNDMRAHYRQEERPRERNGGSGGGVSLALNTPPEFVYAVFDKDTIAEGESVTLSVDARDNEVVESVDAVIVHEDGEVQIIPLALTAGAAGYGTWTTILTGIVPGRYSLSEVIMSDDRGANATAPVSDRAFYVLGDEVLTTENLLLVYGLLNRSTVPPGGEVGIKLDVRDYLGVESVDALLRSRDREIPVKLELISGTPNYGTWGGSVRLTDSDATFALVSATMSNGNETKETRIYGQKVYVEYVKPAALIAQENAPEQDGLELREIVRNPVTPLLIGLIGMGLAMLIVSSMAFMKTEK